MYIYIYICIVCINIYIYICIYIYIYIYMYTIYVGKGQIGSALMIIISSSTTTTTIITTGRTMTPDMYMSERDKWGQHFRGHCKIMFVLTEGLFGCSR